MKTITFALLIFIAGCCTLKDCDSTEIPTVYLTISTDSIKGFTSDQIKNLIIKVYDNNYSFIDSFFYWDAQVDLHHAYNPVIRLDNYTIQRKIGKSDITLYNYLFVIQDSIHTDTLSSVKYSLNSEKVNCNSCFPFGDGRATQTSVTNFSCIFNSKLISSKSDTLRIEK